MIQENKLKAYIQLTKPGIIIGNLITCVSGFFLASKGNLNYELLTWTMLGLSFIVASGCVFNNFIDKKSDEKMERTKKRVLVTKEIPEINACILAIALFVLGSAFLLYFVNILAFTSALIGFVVYIFFYTYLKYKTSYSTLIGSIAGAMPPVVGYVAKSNGFDLPCFLLFLIVVFWQMPHFYAIAIYRLKEYKAANIPVLPLVKGIKLTKVEMLYYTIAYVISCLLLALMGYVGTLYLVLASVLGIYWIALCVKGLKQTDDFSWAKKMFRFSLIVVTILSSVIYFDVIA